MIWKNPDNLSVFLLYAQKLAGQQCYPATQVFAPLAPIQLIAKLDNLCCFSLGLCIDCRFPYPDNKEIQNSYVLAPISSCLLVREHTYRMRDRYLCKIKLADTGKNMGGMERNCRFLEGLWERFFSSNHKVFAYKTILFQRIDRIKSSQESFSINFDK